MARESIDWAGQFQEARLGNLEPSAEAMDVFIGRAVTELAILHVPQEVLVKVRAADCEVQGVRYFTKLYSDDPTVTVDERIKSAFTGSVAHGREDLATEAYTLLLANSKEEPNTDLIERLNTAMKQERWGGNHIRLRRLERAAKALGKPLIRRTLGGLATGLAAHAR